MWWWFLLGVCYYIIIVLLLVAKDYDIQHLIVETLRNIPETPCHINLNLVLTFDVVVVLTWCLLLYYYSSSAGC